MPQDSEIARVEDLLKVCHRYMGICHVSENLLLSFDHLNYYLRGLKREEFVLDYDCSRWKDALDFLRCQLRNRVDTRAQLLYAIGKVDRSDFNSMKDQDVFLSGKLFPPLERYLVLEIMSAPIFEAIEFFRCYKDSGKERNLGKDSFFAQQALSERGFFVHVIKLSATVAGLLKKKRNSLLTAYRSAVNNYGAEESLLARAWDQWQYKDGLPFDHPIFETNINHFRALFVKD